MFHVFGSIAHFGRLISERTRDGIATARKRGRTPGRPPLDPETVSAAEKLIAVRIVTRSSRKTLDVQVIALKTDLFTGAKEPYANLKRALRAKIDEAAWSSLYRTVSRAFDKPETGKFAVKVINHYGDEVLKVFEI